MRDSMRLNASVGGGNKDDLETIVSTKTLTIYLFIKNNLKLAGPAN